MEKGVVYIATGEKCRQEAIRSAKSLKKHNPSLIVAIFTEASAVDPVFDHTHLIENPDFSTIDKMKSLWKTPFQKTIFLDADTFVTGNLLPLFDLLERVDFAGTHEVARGFWYTELQDQIPDAFCELNGGMLVFKSTPSVIKLLKDWHDTYLQTKQWLPRYGTHKWMLTNDQPSLRYLLFKHPEVKLWVLPTEYNALRHQGTYLFGEAKIVHGRDNIEDVAVQMNRHGNLERSFFQGLGIIADFGRIPLKSVLEIVFRVNACAILDLYRRAARTIKTGLQRLRIRG